MKLPRRQQQCLELIVQGKTAKQAGYELGINGRSVSRNLERTRARLGARTMAQLGYIAAELGLVKRNAG